MKTIAEHTIDFGFLKTDSKILDLGCRAFSWSNAMLEQGIEKIYCVDADPSVISQNEMLPVLNAAVWDKNEKLPFVMFGNGTGNRVPSDINEADGKKLISVQGMKLPDIIKKCFDCDFIDLVKMDIEGAEIPVILSLKNPPAIQLSVEFHLHTGTPLWQVKAAMAHLEKLGYMKVFEDYSEKHGCGFNYWDVLFILNNNQ